MRRDHSVTGRPHCGEQLLVISAWRRRVPIHATMDTEPNSCAGPAAPYVDRATKGSDIAQAHQTVVESQPTPKSNFCVI